VTTKQQKLVTNAYASAHVCADITEKLSSGKYSPDDAEKVDWLLTEARNVACAAQALSNQVHGQQAETVSS